MRVLSVLRRHIENESHVHLQSAFAASIAACCLTACAESFTAPPDQTVSNLTVDAADGWVYVALEDVPREVAVTGAVTSTEWDIAFQGTAVLLNRGESGPAGVVGYCLCANQEATDQAIMAMTAASEASAFEVTTASAIPPESGWIEDTAPLGGVFERTPWYRYDLAGNHQIWPTFDVYLIRTGGEVYKIQITNYYGADGKARQITFRSARVQG